jgi:membrane fusion protein, multidrug efflux system
MRKNLVTATLIAVGLLLGLSSGLFFSGEDASDGGKLVERGLADERQLSAAQKADKKLPRVRVRIIEAQPRTRFLVLRGRTQSKRMVDVKAELAGKIISRPVERGQHVGAGDVLCQIAIDDREASVAEAKAGLEDARIEYQGSLKLKEQGLQSQTAIARAAARLEAARAELHRRELDLQRTNIVAPFAGVIEQLQMNVGDYATRGASCATLIDLDPMLVTANVTEAEVDKLQAGDQVFGSTGSGTEINGELTFVGKQSDPLTRTYPVEVTVENVDYSIRSGLTVSLRIALEEVQALQISAALLTLNDSGQLGIRTVGEDHLVNFHPVTILEDSPDGIWITGLPDRVLMITVGQESVLAGQMVEPVYPGTDAVSVLP